MCPPTSHKTHSYETCSLSANETAFVLARDPTITSYNDPTDRCRNASPNRSLSPIPEDSEYPEPPLNSKTRALVPIEKGNFISALHLAFPDPYLRVLVSYAFRDSILAKPLTPAQTREVRGRRGHVERVFFCPDTADRIAADFKELGRMVLLAANGLGDNPEGTPLSYPREVLEFEWGLSAIQNPFPHITFTTSSDEMLRSAYGNSYQALQEIYTILQFVARRYALWIAEQVCRSVSKGYLSETQWGAYFGLNQDETLARLTRKTANRLQAEKERIYRQKMREEKARADIRKAMGDESNEGCELIHHPVDSNLAKSGLFAPYDPTNPTFQPNDCVPRVRVYEDEEDWDQVLEMIRLRPEEDFQI
ncbi:hypothetical protein K435DRAFT_804466 [Dendrothele bispora CBS 962.96]|uniref:Uncharacterized protein n=1 Tax=Dendrothele bispora (strain CBS 962.96) TaxID=1314807 RepID=A0A4S8LED9_DENBC|nr:hypothetical protein K435DRAFT_804466 [Dendrothele bispora CBS 962.96]